MVPSGLLNVSQASANSATSPSVLVKGVPSIASAIASDGNGLLDVGVTHGVVCVSNGGFVLCDHDEDRVCCGDRRQRNRPRWSGGAGGDGKEATSGNNS
jgi:hypothetical protein